MSTIALCIPAYNAAWCLPRLLISAKNQVIPFDEILVYNDSSTDNTAEIAEEYGVKIINGTKNQGCSFGKNALAEIVNSEWIHFHDADDELLPNFTSIAHRWLEKKNLDIILLNYEYREYETGEFLSSPSYNRLKLIEDPCLFFLENKIVNFAICKRESFLRIDGFDLDSGVLYNEDRAFYARAIISNLKFDYEDTVTCINFKYPNSMSQANDLKCAIAYLNVSKKIITSIGDKYPKEIAKGLWHNATIAGIHQDWELVKEHIKIAKNLNGRNPIGQNLTIRLFSIISPFLAYWLREKMIRIFKRHLRK